MTEFEPLQSDITSNIDLLLAVLPPTIRQALDDGSYPSADLLEIVLDLGRPPEARYREGERALGSTEIMPEDIEYVINRIGVFGEDNRAGIPRTLHRISAIRNRQGNVIGLTCRVGRAVFGTIAIIRDLVEQGQSLLLLGRPGVGKTTLLRETARVLADELRKRVVIVDTSNEIAGDGDIPHPGIGRARRMQVPHVVEQHAVMIEAVENHMPEVIVIDEIGTEQEAQAARTIAERGVQLIGTAHGNALENLMLNPTLSDLIGGIQAVTLGDEEARYRGTQKTVLERKAPPTFDVLVEIKSWNEMVIYTDVAAAVDALLRGEEVAVELRQVEADGVVRRELTRVTEARGREGREGRQKRSTRERRARVGRDTAGRQERAASEGGGRQERAAPEGEGRLPSRARSPEDAPATQPGAPPAADQESATDAVESPIARIQRQLRERAQNRTQRIFPLNISRNRLQQAISRLHVPAIIVEDIADATMVLTLNTSYRQNPQLLHAAEDAGVPVYVLRANALEPIEARLADIFGLLPDAGS